MRFRSIEISYDMAAIPGTGADERSRALDFRNVAMELMESALLAARAGEWEGAEIGRARVNFGFAVRDFEVAEAIVRGAVAGTPYQHFRSITRAEYAPAAG